MTDADFAYAFDVMLSESARHRWEPTLALMDTVDARVREAGSEAFRTEVIYERREANRYNTFTGVSHRMLPVGIRLTVFEPYAALAYRMRWS